MKSYKVCRAYFLAVLVTALLVYMPALLAQSSPTGAQSLECRIDYKTSGALSFRSVQLRYQGKKINAVFIDEQPVYTFNLVGQHKILTSVDGERIQIEFQKGRTLWHSNLRDQLFGEGVCVLIPVTVNDSAFLK